MGDTYSGAYAAGKPKRSLFSCLCAKGVAEDPLHIEVEDLYPEYADAPKAFRCPITMNIMLEPVATCDGHTYEKSAIEEWLRVKKTSPVTGQRLRTTELLQNHALKVAIQRWIEEKEGKRKQSTVPDIRKKPEPPDLFAQIGSNAAVLQKQLQESVGHSMSFFENGWKFTASAFGQATSTAASTIGQLPHLAGPLLSGIRPPQGQPNQPQSPIEHAPEADDLYHHDDWPEDEQQHHRRGHRPRGRVINVQR